MDKKPPLSFGKLWLVGAGPGDPDLLTLRAARLLQTADLVVHDGLVGAGVLDLIPPHVERISVAKQRSRHTMKQELINELLVRETLAGRQVVRLKGGDPFIFGRGGEELEAARAAGISCETVPGITAAAGCAAQAGLPLTHRDDASAVSFVAGQCKDLSDQNWAGLAGHGRTLVIYMGVATAAAISEKLIADGVSPALPVAVIERGTSKDARILRSLLADLGDLVRRQQVASPALIVVGEVAKRADALDCLGAPGLTGAAENNAAPGLTGASKNNAAPSSTSTSKKYPAPGLTSAADESTAAAANRAAAQESELGLFTGPRADLLRNQI